MSSVKNILGDYTISTLGPNDKVTVNTNTMTINGNLIVTGVSTSVDSTNTTIWDNIITLNGGTSPGTSPTQNAGIEVDRGNQANVTLRWNETVKYWQVTNDGTNYGNIVTSGPDGRLIFIANIDVLGYSIYSSTTNYVKFDDNVAIQNSTVTPAPVTGYNVVYAQTPGGGGSGLYVTNTTNTQELATQAAAIKYSIIFG